MKAILKNIIDLIPHGMLFDAHTIVEMLLQKYTDEYLTSFTGGSVESYHGVLSRYIQEFEGDYIKRAGLSFSKNIRDEFSKCACWEKI